MSEYGVRSVAVLRELLAEPSAMVQVQEAFMHCGRAINRARLWKSDTWPAADALASMAQMLVDQTALPGLEVVALDSMLKTLVTEELY